jgi:thiosulfate/3-mercaptopyruvate sulfurtransferase
MLLTLTAMAALAAGPTPRPELLVDPATLATAGVPAGTVLLDVREAKEYAAGHVPGAVPVDAAAWGKAFVPPPDAADWSARLGAAGIDPAAPVIVYGAADVRNAARVWWILRYWGVRDVRLVDGGYPAWQAAGGKPSTDPATPKARTVTLAPRRERLATKGELLELLPKKSLQVIDTRSEAEYCGEATTAKRNGAVPGAVRLEWTEVLDPKTKRFRPLPELAALLAERKIDPDKPAVTYCQGGGRASVVAFALELMGGKQVRNYYASWAEWGNAEDTPVEKPAKK